MLLPFYFLSVNDVAVLRLMRPLTFNSTVSAVCMADSSAHDYAGATALVTRWIDTDSTSHNAGGQQEIQVNEGGKMKCFNLS